MPADHRTSLTGRRWRTAKRAPATLFEQLPGLPPLAVQLLYNRSYRDPDSIATLVSRAELPFDPFLMSGMDRAVARILKAIQTNEAICVYADYDADGVCGAAVLIHALRSVEADVRHYIPNRFDEGYGLNVKAVSAIRAAGAGLLISTDCGANAVQEVSHALEIGLDVIVTDHHVVNLKLPAAAAALNPRHPGEPYPFPDLAGVGVAYKLAEALLLEAQSPSAIDPESLLDFVALGTVADVAPLRDENRWAVREGLKLINQSPRPGIQALLDAAGLRPGTVTARDLAFRLGPRVNAPGRMEEAGSSLDLLLASDAAVAARLAGVLTDLNRRRQAATEKVVQAAAALAAGSPVVFAHGDDWPLGVLGLVAGRICGESGRPAYISAAQGGEVRGSARGPDGFDVLGSLHACARLLSRYGGHLRAAGFSLHASNLREFHDRLRLHWESLPIRPEIPAPLTADCRLRPSSISSETLQIQTGLEPYGESFPEPVYVCAGLTLGRAQTVGDNARHLRLAFRELPAGVAPIWFGMGTVADELEAGGSFDIAFRLGLNSFRGEERIDMVVEDVRRAS